MASIFTEKRKLKLIRKNPQLIKSHRCTNKTFVKSSNCTLVRMRKLKTAKCNKYSCFVTSILNIAELSEVEGSHECTMQPQGTQLEQWLIISLHWVGYNND